MANCHSLTLCACLCVCVCLRVRVHVNIEVLSLLVCVNIRVLDVLDLAADAIPVTETPEVIVVVNVVVEVVARNRATLQQSGLTTTGLRGGNMVFLPAALFSLSIVPETTRFTAVSINNRNLIRPRARNNRLRSNIISVNLNTTEPLRSLTDDERIQLTFNLVSSAKH